MNLSFHVSYFHTRSLTICANSEDITMRSAAAASPYTTLGILEKLVHDDSEYVRYWVARSPFATLDILRKLSCDSSDMVRQGVRLNRHFDG